MYKKSGNPKIEELTKSWTKRSFNLSDLKPIVLDELNKNGKPKRLCAWCAEVEIFHFNRKYCNETCANSAMAWAYPQKEDALRNLLHRQEWKCLLCKFDYLPFLQALVAGDRRLGHNVALESLAWYYFKRLKARVPQERRLEIDHVVPIYKGGNALGLDNHQAICMQCHRAKTSKDLSGKRKKISKD